MLICSICLMKQYPLENSDLINFYFNNYIYICALVFFWNEEMFLSAYKTQH